MNVPSKRITAVPSAEALAPQEPLVEHQKRALPDDSEPSQPSKRITVVRSVEAPAPAHSHVLNTPTPELWHHDLLHRDGSPFDQAEVDTFHKLTAPG